jgi:hypothetical protein
MLHFPLPANTLLGSNERISRAIVASITKIDEAGSKN